jgi:hypothetical protein
VPSLMSATSVGMSPSFFFARSIAPLFAISIGHESEERRRARFALNGYVHAFSYGGARWVVSRLACRPLLERASLCPCRTLDSLFSFVIRRGSRSVVLAGNRLFRGTGGVYDAARQSDT